MIKLLAATLFSTAILGIALFISFVTGAEPATVFAFILAVMIIDDRLPN
jgi:hypothetical protein